MNARLLALLLATSSAGFAGARLSQPALYQPLAESSLSYVAVHPSGICHEGGAPGVVDGCWQTEAPWIVESADGKLPTLTGTHRSATNANTIAQVRTLLETVAIPAAQAELAAPLSVPGVYPTPAIEHIAWASFVLAPNGARSHGASAYPALEVLVVLPSLVEGVPPIRRVVQVPGPYDGADGGTLSPLAVDAVHALITTYVLPAIRAETGLL